MCYITAELNVTGKDEDKMNDPAGNKVNGMLRQLRKELNRKQYDLNSRFPSEYDLADRFGVNLKTANKAGVSSTGNASKAGYDAPVGIRPFTLYLEGGEMTEEELLKQAGNGVYITSLSGLHAGANPITGDFSLQSAGFMVENGEKR